MSDSEKPNFAQRAARSSWQLFLVTVVLVLISRRVPNGIAVPILGALIFLVMVAGAICGLVALAGIASVGAEKVLLPALAGAILNGLLIFIFVTSFIAGRDAALRARARTHSIQPIQSANPGSTAHAGTWETRSPSGETLTWVFTANDVTMILPKGRSAPFPYEFDFTHQPAWLTIHTERFGKPPLLLIVEFVGEDQMRVLGSAPGSQARPVDFGKDRDAILTFTRRH